MPSKAERVIAAAQAATPPWEHEVEEVEGFTTLTLIRGDETMQITWDSKTALIHPLTYTLAGVREVKLRNVSQALKDCITVAPDYKVKKTVQRRVASPPKEVGRSPLPFDIEEASDEEIIKAVRGRKLVWLNQMAGEFEQAVVPGRKLVEVKDPDKPGAMKKVWRTSRNIKMSTTSAGRRVLTFAAVGEQFRSIGLDTLVQVR